MTKSNLIKFLGGMLVGVVMMLVFYQFFLKGDLLKKQRFYELHTLELVRSYIASDLQKDFDSADVRILDAICNVTKAKSMKAEDQGRQESEIQHYGDMIISRYQDLADELGIEYKGC